jgi:hypothetical protein
LDDGPVNYDQKWADHLRRKREKAKHISMRIGEGKCYSISKSTILESCCICGIQFIPTKAGELTCRPECEAEKLRCEAEIEKEKLECQ